MFINMSIFMRQSRFPFVSKIFFHFLRLYDKNFLLIQRDCWTLVDRFKLK